MTKIAVPRFRINLQTVLWLLIWGGMFTGIYNLQDPELFSKTIPFIQGMRALFPHLVLYACLMWILVARVKFPPFLTPLGLYFYYGVTGVIISFLSQDVGKSFFWGSIYLAPIFLLWIIVAGEYSLENMRMILWANYFAVISIFLSLEFELLLSGKISKMGLQFYDLPFKLGEINANGVGRFALIVLILSVVRLLYGAGKSRFLFVLLIGASGHLLMQTQSRTSLLGLGVASVLFVVILGLRWQFFITGPAAAYVIWISGYERRAQQRVDKLLGLSGRETTWQDAFDLIKESPFLGWGFHSDRIMLRDSHIHNSYIHAMIQSGIIGLILFILAVSSIWYIIVVQNVLGRIKNSASVDRPFLIESVLFIGFLSSRSIFESTAAFFGIDLLVLVPAVVYVYLWSKQDRSEERGQ